MICSRSSALNGEVLVEHIHVERETIASRTISESTSGGMASHCTVSPSNFAVRVIILSLGGSGRQIHRVRLLAGYGDAHHFEPFSAGSRYGCMSSMKAETSFERLENISSPDGSRSPTCRMVTGRSLSAIHFGKLVLLGDAIITAAGLRLHAKRVCDLGQLRNHASRLRTGEENSILVELSLAPVSLRHTHHELWEIVGTIKLKGLFGRHAVVTDRGEVDQSGAASARRNIEQLL